jgi:hypothetical protein
MKKFFLLGVIFLLIGCAGNRTWTKADYAREAAFVGLTIIDWGQTRNIAKHPDDYGESNPILGRHPSVGRVNTYFPLAIAGHIIATHYIPHPYRPWWQYIWIAREGYAVGRNYSFGVRMEW